MATSGNGGDDTARNCTGNIRKREPTKLLIVTSVDSDDDARILSALNSIDHQTLLLDFDDSPMTDRSRLEESDTKPCVSLSVRFFTLTYGHGEETMFCISEYREQSHPV